MKNSKQRRKDLSNKKFGLLTAISYDIFDGRHSHWKCKCGCGNECIVRADSLLAGTTQSCGCKNAPKLSDSQIKIAYDLYIDENKSPNELGKMFYCSDTTIIKHFKKTGLHLKDVCVANRTYTINSNIFDNIDSEEKAYWLGFLYADGCVVNSNRSYQTIFSLAETDVKAVENFSKFIFGEVRTSFCTPKQKHHQKMVKVIVCNKHIVETLTAFGCVPNKSLILKFPRWLKSEMYNHFIRGYFDGDGCIGLYKNKRSSYIYARFNIIGTNDFTTYMAKIFGIQQIKSTIIQAHRCKQNTKALIISGNRQIEKLMDWLYKDATIYLERKHNKYLELKEINRRTTLRKENRLCAQV